MKSESPRRPETGPLPEADWAADFEAADLTERLHLGKVACLLVIFLMPLGMTLDVALYPHNIVPFLILRLVCSALVAVVLALHFTAFGRRHAQPLSWLIALLPALFIALMIADTQGWNSPYYAGLNLILLATNVVVHWGFVESLLTSLLMTGMYVGACLWNQAPPQEGVGYNNLYFLTTTGIIVLTGNYFYNRLRLREFKAQRQLKASQTELERSNHDLKVSQQELEHSNRRLRELDELKGRFFANVSHELRTPLTLVLGPLETLRQMPALREPPLCDYLETMHGNSMRLLKLINDLLDLVRLDAGQLRLHLTRIDPEPFVQGTLNAVRRVAEDRGLILGCRIDPGLTGLVADPDKLEKVFLNLLFNAMKFTPAGGTIQINAVREAGCAVFEVTDTGMGIAAENLPHLFSRFWQADSSTQRKYQGAGIGLALVKELIEAHGGTVGAESQLGKGTTIRFRLPADTGDAPGTTASEVDLEEANLSPHAAAATPARRPEDHGAWLGNLYRRAELFGSITPLKETLHGGWVPTEGRAARVLLVDDEPDMLRFLRGQLERDYEVVEASDGNQAVTLAAQYLPDVVVCDLMLPEKDGLTVCRELRDHPATRGLAVIVLTARADDDTKLRALEAGANDFLSKPFSLAELHARVKNLSEGRQMAKALTRQNQRLEATLEQLKETELQLVQAEKMASLGRMSAGIIHEINNPLNFTLTALNVLSRQAQHLPASAREDYEDTLQDIQEGVRRVAKIITDLREFSHPQGGAIESAEVLTALNSALRFLTAEWRDKVEVENHVPEGFSVWAVNSRLIQVFVNLLQNSLDALRTKSFAAGCRPTIRVTGRSEPRVKTIAFWDNGPGIAEQNLVKVFDPFFTTKEVGQGTGLGLSICFRLLHEVGAGISVRSQEGEWCEFVLTFPDLHEANPVVAFED